MSGADDALDWMNALFANTPSAIFALDPNGIVMLVNKAAERLSGYSRAEILGHSFALLLPPRFADRVFALSDHYVGGAIGLPDGFDGGIMMQRPDGVEVPVELSIAVASDETSTYVVSVWDITERRDAEEALRFSVKRLEEERQALADLAFYQRVLDRIARGENRDQTLVALCGEVEARFPGVMCTVMIPDETGMVLRVGAGPSLPAAVWAQLDGLPIADGVGACGTTAATGKVTVIDDTLTDPRTDAFLELARRHNLRAVWSSPLFDPDNVVLGTFAIYRQVPHVPNESELKGVSAIAGLAALAIQRDSADRALRLAAERDTLTGLPTRAVFLKGLDELIAQPDAQVAVMFLDLDRFKWINDSIGHPAGDEVLAVIGDRILAAVRETDAEALIGRFGGDEFTVAIANADRSKAETVARRLIDVITCPLDVGGRQFFLSVSIGISFSASCESAARVVSDADAAMYSAKERGGDRWVFFNRELRERIMRRVSRENDMRLAVERDEFVMEYQPIVSLLTGDRVGYEALVRWEHPGIGRLGPREFIPLAEETGYIVTLGTKIFDLSIGDAVTLVGSTAHERIGINVSAVQLADPGIVSVVENALAKHGLEPRHLTIEVTESGFMEKFEHALGSLQRLVDLGVRVVIDDFGTGYSSIARMSELPISGVKVDQSFTRWIVGDERAESVLASITKLAHAFGLFVTAEGIESAEAYEIARRCGCDRAQGYYIARPQAVSTILEGQGNGG